MGASTRGPNKEVTIKDDNLKDITQKLNEIVGSKKV